MKRNLVKLIGLVLIFCFGMFMFGEDPVFGETEEFWAVCKTYSNPGPVWGFRLEVYLSQSQLILETIGYSYLTFTYDRDNDTITFDGSGPPVTYDRSDSEFYGRFDEIMSILNRYYYDGSPGYQEKLDSIAYSFESGELTNMLRLFYSDSKRLKSETFREKDEKGNIYYHYIDDELNLMDVSQLAEANGKGEISFEYTYYEGSDKVHFKDSYTDVARTQHYKRYEYDENGNLVEGNYTYYPSGRLESKTLVESDPDGNIYYHYIDEDFKGQGYGRTDIQIRQTVDMDGAIAYLTEYHDGTDILKKKTLYSTANYTDPSNPVLSGKFVEYIYDTDGITLLVMNTYAVNSRGDLVLETKTIPGGDAEGNVYYRYHIWSWGDVRGPRLRYKAMLEKDENGAIAYTYNESASGLEVAGYATADYTDPLNPVFSDPVILYRYNAGYYDYTDSDLIYTLKFYSSGNIRSKIFTSPDEDGNIYYYYNDETFYSTSFDFGRIAISAKNVPDRFGAIGFEYEYYEGTDSIRYKTGYVTADYSDVNNPVLDRPIVIFEYDMNEYNPKTIRTYYASGCLESITHIYDWYYHFLDENFDGRGYGRTDIIYKSGDAGYKMEYYGDTENIRKLTLYGTCDYAYPSSPLLLDKKVEYFMDTDGTTLLRMDTFYYDYPDSRLESTILTEADAMGGIYYHFINEDFDENGNGRIDRKVMAEKDEAGVIAYYYEYHGSTGVFSKIIGYSGADISNVGNPVLTEQTVQYEFYPSGDLKLRYTYFTSGLLESKTLTYTDQFGNRYYHYTDDLSFLDPVYDPFGNRYYSRNYGLVDKEIRETSDIYGAMGYEFEYYDGTDIKKTATGYAFADYSDPKKPFLKKVIVVSEYDENGDMKERVTYYASGRLESRTFTEPDENGNVYYHYLDEDWEGSGHGRVDLEVMASEDETGSTAYAYAYRDVPDTVEYKKGYADVDCSDPNNPVLGVPVIAYKYKTPSANGPYDMWTYYGSGRLESLTLGVTDKQAYRYYHFMDELFYDNGTPEDASDDFGRVDVQASSAPINYINEYHGDTDVFKKRTRYSEADYSDPMNPELTGAIVSFEYDENGNLINTERFSSQTSSSKGAKGGNVKGISMEEVVSKNASIKKNVSEFTGYSPDEEEPVMPIIN